MEYSFSSSGIHSSVQFSLLHIELDIKSRMKNQLTSSTSFTIYRFKICCQ